MFIVGIPRTDFAAGEVELTLTGYLSGACIETLTDTGGIVNTKSHPRADKLNPMSLCNYLYDSKFLVI